MLKAILRKSGTSLVVTIPPTISDLMNIKEGSEFEMELEENQAAIILRKL